MVDEHKVPAVGRRQFLLGLGAVSAAVAIPSVATTACGGAAVSSGSSSSSSGSTKTLTVGFIIPLGGVFEVVGAQMKNGFQLYLDTHGGKLGGRPVNLVVGDEGSDPATAQQTGQRIIYNDKAEFVAGVVTSSAAVALRDTFNTAKVPLVIANANVTALSTTALSPWVYRTSASFAQQGGSAGKWYYDNIAKSNVWTMADDFVGGHDIVNAFTKSFTAAGGTVAGSIFSPFLTTTNYGPYLTQVKNADAKGVFAFYGGSEAIDFVKQYSSFGLRGSVPIAGQGSLVDASVLAAEGSAGLNFPATGNYYVHTLENPVNATFRSQYKSKHGQDPAYYACSAYDAAQLIDLALTKTHGSTSDKTALVSALENPGTFRSPRGPMRMDPKTHNPIEHFYIYENVQENGAIVPRVLADVGEFAQPVS